MQHFGWARADVAQVLRDGQGIFREGVAFPALVKLDFSDKKDEFGRRGQDGKGNGMSRNRSFAALLMNKLIAMATFWQEAAD